MSHIKQRSKWILNRKLNVSVGYLIDVIVKIERDLSKHDTFFRCEIQAYLPVPVQNTLLTLQPK